MAESNDFSLGYALGQDNKGGGIFGNDGIWGILLFAMIFGWGGGGYGFGGGFGGGLNGALTRAELYDGFAIQNIDSAVRNVQNGISDATYALTNTLTNGFHGVDRGLCDVSHQISDCCCTTQKAVGEVNFNLSKGFCDLGNVINMQTRDIIENQNANYRGIMDFMVQSKLDALRAENENLRLRASQADQNAVIRAAIDASTAEIIRRTGNDCPTPAYWVSPPTPVSVPFNNGCGCGI